MFVITRGIASIFVIVILATGTARAESPQVQKIPLSFRKDGKPGIVADVVANGESFQLLVDTGSAGQVLYPSIVKKLGLKTRESLSGDTPYGTVEMAHVGSVQIKIHDTSLELTDALTNLKQPPGGLEDDGIVGLLSPPALAANALAVVDAGEPALYVVTPTPKDIPSWLKTHFKGVAFDEVPRIGDPSTFKEIIGVQADRFGSLQMFLDTGATTTNIYSSVTADPSRPVSLRIGSHECLTQQAHIRPLASGASHLLGMDCLRGKILGFGPRGSKSVWIGWSR